MRLVTVVSGHTSSINSLVTSTSFETATINTLVQLVAAQAVTINNLQNAVNSILQTPPAPLISYLSTATSSFARASAKMVFNNNTKLSSVASGTIAKDFGSPGGYFPVATTIAYDLFETASQNILKETETIGALPWNTSAGSTTATTSSQAPVKGVVYRSISLPGGSASIGGVGQIFTSSGVAYSASMWVHGNIGDRVYLYMNFGNPTTDIPDLLIQFTGADQWITIPNKILTAGSQVLYFDSYNHAANSGLPAVSFQATAAQVVPSYYAGSYIQNLGSTTGVAVRQQDVAKTLFSQFLHGLQHRGRCSSTVR